MIYMETKKEFKKRLLDPQLDQDLRHLHEDARVAFNALPEEKKEKSLKAKSFIIYPFEVRFNQSKTFEEKESDSLELVKNHLRTFNNVFVSTSHGNDSIVLCHLVLRAWKELKNEGIDKPKPEFWLNNTLNVYKEERAYWVLINKILEIEDTFIEFKPPVSDSGKQYTVWSVADEVGHLPSFRSVRGQGNTYDEKTHGSKTNAAAGSRGYTPECCDILKKASIKNYLKETFKSYIKNEGAKKYDCHFVGTRAEESSIRMLGVMQRCRSYTIRTKWPYPIRACTPLSYWKDIDIDQYYIKHAIPRNPVYKIHNLIRMGCASCPAHKYWEIRLARDPTDEGFGMLEKNLTILKNTQIDRFNESINTLKKAVKSKKVNGLTDEMKLKITNLINKLST